MPPFIQSSLKDTWVKLVWPQLTMKNRSPNTFRAGPMLAINTDCCHAEWITITTCGVDHAALLARSKILRIYAFTVAAYFRILWLNLMCLHHAFPCLGPSSLLKVGDKAASSWPAFYLPLVGGGCLGLPLSLQIIRWHLFLFSNRTALSDLGPYRYCYANNWYLFNTNKW